MKKKMDQMWVGIVAGLVGGVIGFLLFHLLAPLFGKTDIIYAFINYKAQRAPILSVSIFFNLLVFFLFIWNKMYLSARGVILSMFVYGIAIVYFKLIA